ncbi:MAG: YbaB/EbfC family nucleoid-associated protein [Synergistota bacterium]|nr:YbaB/EbfC family nucleoid-associated protein [Synergistota bacterium]
MKMDQMLKQAQNLQAEMAKAQEQLAEERVEGISGGGMVKVTANGRGDILGISIDPEVLDPDDKEILEDLVLAAINEAARKTGELSRERLGKLGGNLGIPGLF